MRTVTMACLIAAGLALSVGPLAAQDHGGGSGGGGRCGDVFGDLIHVLRDGTTGQPILARRFVELPKEVPGYGWGYCTIALTSNGAEIPFLPFSCDPDLDADDDGVEELDPVEVDYLRISILERGRRPTRGGSSSPLSATTVCRRLFTRSPSIVHPPSSKRSERGSGM